MNAIDRSLGSAKPLTLYGVEIPSRLLLGTARYPSPQVLSDAVRASRVSVLTVSVRREQARGNTGTRFFELSNGSGMSESGSESGVRSAARPIVVLQSPPCGAKY